MKFWIRKLDAGLTTSLPASDLGSTAVWVFFFTVLRVPFVICPFRGADAKSGKIVQEIPRTWHKRASGS